MSALRTVEAGERVSYGHRWRAPRRTRVATLPVGYADGLRRGLSGRIRVRLGGHDLPQIGTVTMDQVMVDVGEVDVEVGQVATLLGDPAKGEPGVGEWSAAGHDRLRDHLRPRPASPASTTAPASPAGPAARSRRRSASGRQGDDRAGGAAAANGPDGGGTSRGRAHRSEPARPAGRDPRWGREADGEGRGKPPRPR